MRIKLNLQAKTLILVLSTLFIVFILIGVYIGHSKKKFAIEKAHEYAQFIAKDGATKVKSVFTNNIAYVNSSASALSVIIKNNAYDILEISKIQLDQALRQNKNLNKGWVLISNNILNEGDVGNWSLYEMKNEGNSYTLEQQIESDANQVYSIIEKASSPSFSNLLNQGNKQFIDIYAPIVNGSKKVGYFGLQLSMNEFLNIVENSGIVEQGTVAILSNNGIYAAHSNNVYTGNKYAETFLNLNKDFSVDANITNEKSFEINTHIEGQEYYTFFTPIKIDGASPAWAIEVNVPMKKMLASTKKSTLYSAMISLIGLIIIALMVYSITQKLLNPIKQTTKILDLLSEGNIKEIHELKIDSSDELQQMGKGLNNVVASLRKTENFAIEIRDGNLSNTYAALGSNDQLGNALLQMRDSLKLNKQEQEKRKKEDEQAAWATNGIAKFSEILRQDNDNMKKLGYRIMSNLVQYLNCNQGALFVLNQDDDKDHFFELVTTIAFGRDKYMQKEIRIGEGLVGRCAFEQKTIFITDVPKDFHHIKSGLGDSSPACILIVPCLLNDEVYGIIEIASFTPLKPFEIEFVEKLGESIGSTIASVRINIKTTNLLSASKNQSEELAAQEEELRQNLEEMEATQEDLKRQMLANTEMHNALQKQNALLDALLTSLPDYIYFKDHESKFLRISQSMTHLFGTNSVDDIVGKSDFDFQSPENAQKYYADEQRIMQTLEGFTDRIQKEIMPDGRIMWNSVSKLPLLTADGECFGTFGISKNVTDLKNLEIEAKKNSTLLDALLNSLPDYIYFKDLDSKFLRISKSMTHLFGANSVEEIVGKSDFDFQTPENAKKYYDDEQGIIKTKNGITNQMQKEVTGSGDVIWTSVTKLPLITNEGDCMGTFGISKDVTELKNLELESSKQNVEILGMVNAIKKVAYTAEYDINGVVIDANQALLDLLKLNLKTYIGSLNKDEISGLKGKEYQNFWNDIIKGESKSITNKIKVGNKNYNLFETYTPVYSEDNSISKILRIAFDITELA